MYEEIGDKTLKNGEKMPCAVIAAPDDEWADRIVPFLAHKGGIWVRQIERTLREDLEPLSARYYVLHLSPDDLVSNITIYRTGKVGILGHVFTQPTHRRKGAASILMRASIEDFRASGGEACFLGTGYDSPPYHIYRKYGFQSVYEGTGFMEYYTEARARFLADFYRAGETKVGPVRFSDWPLLDALLSHEMGGILRLPSRGQNGRTSFEGGFLSLIEDVDAGRAAALVARSKATGAAVALTIVQEDSRFHGVKTLDAFAHPNFQGMIPVMVEELVAGTSGPVLAQVDSSSDGRIEALRKAGFKEAARLPGMLTVPPGFGDKGGRSDLVLLSKGVSG